MDAVRVQALPIPTPTNAARKEVETAVRRLITITAEKQSGVAAILDWLRLEFGIEKASQKLQAVTDLDATALADEVKKLRGKKRPLSVADLKRLKDEHATSVVPLQTLAAEADQLERRVSDLVNEAFGLTPEEVALMWQTAPPRMPISV